MYNQALQNARLFGVSTYEIRPVLISLGDLRREQGKHAEAAKLYQETADAASKQGDSSTVRSMWLKLAQLNADDRKFAEAKDFQSRALALTDKQFGPNSQEAAVDVSRLGDYEFHSGDFAAAERRFVQALELGKASHIDEFFMQTVEANKADVYRKTVRKKEAAKIYERILNERSNNAGQNNITDINTSDVLAKYVGLMHELGQDTAARTMVDRFAPKLAGQGVRTDVSPYQMYLDNDRVLQSIH
jgi:tetratricopeptide (TPR) repeat protein